MKLLYILLIINLNLLAVDKDKKLHFMYSVPIGTTYVYLKNYSFWGDVLFATSSGVGIGLLKELRDKYDNNPKTKFELNDLKYDFYGSFIGAILGEVIKKNTKLQVVSKVLPINRTMIGFRVNF